MKKRMTMVCYVLAALCIVYCLGVVLTKAAGTRFFLIWLFAAAFFAFLGVAVKNGLWYRLPLPGKAVCLGLACLGASLFCFVEGLVLSGFSAKGEPGLSYIIVLGAQMKQNGPSVALARRLDAACRYLEENPDTVCVVSGGQGSNEPVSEAEGMYEYLVKKGIAPLRIIKEEQSVRTAENLAFSRKLIPGEVKRVGIVTSNFHVYRSVALARRQGFPEAVGIAASSGLYFLPNNMLREFFGIMKDRMLGNMKFF